jgi:uncharacterized OB-fold protein
MQENKEQQCLPMAPGIFTTPEHGKHPALLGGYCSECDQSFFPRPPRCPHCLGEVTDKSLGSTGKLYTYTMVRVKPPWGLPRPYSLGYVDLDECGLRVLGLLDPRAMDNLEIGSPLRLAVGELGVNLQGNPCLRPYFKPADTQKTTGVENG